MNNNLYELTFDEELMDGVYQISLVSDPAIGVEMLKFNKEKRFTFSNDEKKIIVSPVLIPDQKVYRRDISGTGEGYVFVTAETIEKLQSNFFKNKFNHNSSIEHSHKIDDGVYVIESWLIEDPLNDKANALGFDNLPKGTWVVTIKIDNEDVWNNYIKTGDITGISMDALLQPVKSNNNINFSTQMKKVNFKKALRKAVTRRIAFNAELIEIKISEEVSYFVESLEVGKMVYDFDGNSVIDAEFEFEGKVYKTNDEGFLVEVEVINEEVAFSEEDVEAIVEEIKEEIIVDYEAKVAELEVKVAELEAELAIYKEAEAEEVELAKQSPAKRGIKTSFAKDVKPSKGLLGTLRSLK